MTNHSKKLPAACLFFFLAAALAAEPPVFLPRETPSAPLVPSRAGIAVVISPPLCETRIDLVFRNPGAGTMVGSVRVPVPEDALISGFAVDIDGTLVDAVSLPDSETLDEIARHPGDVPGARSDEPRLFRTSGIVLPASGSRMVQVRFVSEIERRGQDLVYAAAIDFGPGVETFSARIEARGLDRPPVADPASVVALPFETAPEGFLARHAGAGCPPPGTMSVILEGAAKPRALVEKAPDGEVFFVAADYADAAGGKKAGTTRRAPRRIAVLWDASASRGTRDHRVEIDFLRQYLATLKDAAVAVELVFVRHDLVPGGTFMVDKGRADSLLSVLQAVDYDGATRFDGLFPVADSAPDLFLLFTDGNATLGGAIAAAPRAPLFVIGAGPAAERARLAPLAPPAAVSGGALIDLGRARLADAVSALATFEPRLVSAEAPGDAVADTVPALPALAGNDVLFAGRLQGAKALLTLRSTASAAPTVSRPFWLSRDKAKSGTMARTYWAYRRTQAFAPGNTASMTEIARRYGIEAPGFSFAVPQDLDALVTHRVPPPPALGWTESFRTAAGSCDRELAEEERTHVDGLLELWTRRLASWLRGPSPPRAPWPAPKTGAGSEPVGEGVEGFLAAADAADADDAERDAEEQPSASSATPDVATWPSPNRNGPDPVTIVVGSSRAEPRLEPWDGAVSYTAALQALPAEAAPEQLYGAYVADRARHPRAPAFYLAAADELDRRNQRRGALQALSNLAELAPSDPVLLRAIAWRLFDRGEFSEASSLLETVLRLDPRTRSLRDAAAARAYRADYAGAVRLLQDVAARPDRGGDDSGLIALTELNAVLAAARGAGAAVPRVDARWIGAFDADLRVVLTWDAPDVDLDLRTIEPDGDVASPRNPLTRIGGRIAGDSGGLGPEEYILRTAPPGRYRVQCRWSASAPGARLLPVTARVEIYTQYGRPAEIRRITSVPLAGPAVIDLTEIELGGGPP